MGSRLSGPDRHAVASAAQYAEDQWKRRQWDAVMRNVAAAPALPADVVEPLEALLMSAIEAAVNEAERKADSPRHMPRTHG